MTERTEQRLRGAAAAVREAADRLDAERMLAGVDGRRSGRGSALLGVAVAAAVVVGALVAVSLARTPPIPIVDPADPAASAPDTGSPTTPPDPEPSACSAAGLPPQPEAQPQLPRPVTALRDEIAQRAVTCDVVGLGDLTADQFSFTFGADDDPVAHWQRLEDQASAGEPGVLEAMRRILDTPPGTMEMASGGGAVYWAWPRLHVLPQDVPKAERDAAVDEVVATGLYSREEVEAMIADLGGYVGYRLMIEVRDDSPDTARWVVFIAGD